MYIVPRQINKDTIMTLNRNEIDFFVLSEDNDSDDSDVPFYNEYVKEYEKSDIPTLDGCYVKQSFVTAKGLLLVGERFKYFLFTKTELYGFVLEYFSKYSSNETLGPRLVMFPSTKSKASLGVSKSDPLCYWKKNGSCYDCNLPSLTEKVMTKAKKVTKQNPLLS